MSADTKQPQPPVAATSCSDPRRRRFRQRGISAIPTPGRGDVLPSPCVQALSENETPAQGPEQGKTVSNNAPLLEQGKLPSPPSDPTLWADTMPRNRMKSKSPDMGEVASSTTVDSEAAPALHFIPVKSGIQTDEAMGMTQPPRRSFKVCNGSGNGSGAALPPSLPPHAVDGDSALKNGNLRLSFHREPSVERGKCRQDSNTIESASPSISPCPRAGRQAGARARMRLPPGMPDVPPRCGDQPLPRSSMVAGACSSTRASSGTVTPCRANSGAATPQGTLSGAGQIALSHELEASQPDAMSAPVLLNVGGTSFATSWSTLSRLPGPLRDMLPPPGAAKEAFVDRDPTHFRLVLNFLRDGTCALPTNDVRALDEVAAEARFYGLRDLEALVLRSIEKVVSHERQADLRRAEHAELVGAVRDGFDKLHGSLSSLGQHSFTQTFSDATMSMPHCGSTNAACSVNL